MLIGPTGRTGTALARSPLTAADRNTLTFTAPAGSTETRRCRVRRSAADPLFRRAPRTRARARLHASSAIIHTHTDLQHGYHSVARRNFPVGSRRVTLTALPTNTTTSLGYIYAQRRTLAYSADRQAASLPQVPSLPALGPSQESIYRVSLTVDLCEG